MILETLLNSLRSGNVEIIDLTATLSEATPVISLPPDVNQTPPFVLEELSRYDSRGPIWYHNAIHTGEHTGTHVDAPVHWVSGRDGLDVASAPLADLIAAAVVVDKSRECAADPDFLLEVNHLLEWQETHGAFPDRAWLIYRTGWGERSEDAVRFLNADEEGPHTPGISPDCARWLAEQPNLIGLGVETVGTDAGQGFRFEPGFPCHHYLLGAGKFGITQLQNVDRLPATGSVLVVSPLKIAGGSGSPARILALVSR